MQPKMACLRSGLCGFGLLLCLLLHACTVTVNPPVPPDLSQNWQTLSDLPPEVLRSLQGSSIEYVPTDEGLTIPVRAFNSEGIKRPLLMVHGLQSHSGWFAQSAAFMASLGHPVYVIDRRGSGLSKASRGDIKDYRDWIIDIQVVAEKALHRHGCRQIYLLGHCFGAIPATLYATSHPDKVKGLILGTPGMHTHTSIPLSQKMKIALSRSGQRDYYFAVPLDTNQFSELREYEPFIEADPLALRAVTGDLYWQIHKARQQILSESQGLTMPLLVGFAGEDEIADNARNRRWLATVPSISKTEIVYPDARHILEFSRERDRYFKDLRNWLSWQEDR
ncbi:MAG: alpha/beta fold hydrolase [Deltaproteobacteria bacterium]|jgi:alpha-beta hydrolase superfamily lysophospholipase|nr:alpha/beta fold hydrolase [Deltaproteobacteria bacterium]